MTYTQPIRKEARAIRPPVTGSCLLPELFPWVPCPAVSRNDCSLLLTIRWQDEPAISHSTQHNTHRKRTRHSKAHGLKLSTVSLEVFRGKSILNLNFKNIIFKLHVLLLSVLAPPCSGYRRCHLSVPTDAQGGRLPLTSASVLQLSGRRIYLYSGGSHFLPFYLPI